MLEQRIKKIEAHVEHLRDLLIEVHAVAAILASTRRNEELLRRLFADGRIHGFRTIRHSLQWKLALELVKITADVDRRVPSITTLVDHLSDERVKVIFRDRFSKPRVPANDDCDLSPELLSAVPLKDQNESIEHFLSIHSRMQIRAKELLQSEALRGMKTIRDKWLGHNELIFDETGYHFLDVSGQGFRPRDEETVLNQATAIFDDINTIVRNASFDWAQCRERFDRDAKAFWQI